MAVCKVPADDMEALKSSLMGLFEKKRVVNLYKFINQVDVNDPKSWNNMDLRK
jgi:Rab GDP dissociation inhibitor